MHTLLKVGSLVKLVVLEMVCCVYVCMRVEPVRCHGDPLYCPHSQVSGPTYGTSKHHLSGLPGGRPDQAHHEARPDGKQLPDLWFIHLEIPLRPVTKLAMFEKEATI